jgi:hypothetical protein
MSKIKLKVLPAMMLAACTSFSLAEPPTHVEPTPRERAAELSSVPWMETIEKEIPPLAHPRGERWPMIMQHGVGTQILPADRIQMLLARGLTQHLGLDKGSIEAARALQEAGSPVIIMQGTAGNWPYSLAADSSAWAHQFDEGYHYKMAGPGPLGEWHGACPKMIGGWEALAEQIRDTLGAFRDAGVTVDAVWMDWEGDPYPWSQLFKQLEHCKRCREQLPAAVLEDKTQFWAYYWRLYQQLYGAYLAAPVREIFPQCSVTNWHIVYSTQTRPLFYFVDNRVMPPSIPPLFSATNPVAYGNDLFWHAEWRDEYPVDRRHVDQFYTHLLLRQISGDAANRLAYAHDVGSFPWVVRWCQLDGEKEERVPDMSREAYREALRHLWLRGIDGMQVFNAYTQDYEELALLELQDAVQAYDQILEHREFLEAGEVMNLEVPEAQDDGVFWSGLRLGERAVLRLSSQGEQAARVELEPWSGHRIELEAPTDGRTYLLGLIEGQVRVLE